MSFWFYTPAVQENRWCSSFIWTSCDRIFISSVIHHPFFLQLSIVSSALILKKRGSDFQQKPQCWFRSNSIFRTEPSPHLERTFPTAGSISYLIYPQKILIKSLSLGLSAGSQDAGVISVHGSPRGGEPEHRGPSEPAERQQPQHRHPQQVPSRGHGGSKSRATLGSERALLQRAKCQDWHEV